MLWVEGLAVNRKRTYLLYIELGMQVRSKRCKKPGAAQGADGDAFQAKRAVVDGFRPRPARGWPSVCGGCSGRPLGWDKSTW